MNSFSLADREMLISVNVGLKSLSKEVEELKTALKEDNKVNKSEFDRLKDEITRREEFDQLKGKVQVLENFRWYILGVAVVAGPLIHYFIENFMLRKG